MKPFILSIPIIIGLLLVGVSLKAQSNLLLDDEGTIKTKLAADSAIFKEDKYDNNGKRFAVFEFSLKNPYSTAYFFFDTNEKCDEIYYLYNDEKPLGNLVMAYNAIFSKIPNAFGWISTKERVVIQVIRQNDIPGFILSFQKITQQ